MDGNGNSVDSEIFGDGPLKSTADFNRSDAYSSAIFQATDEVAAAALIKSLEGDRRLNVTAMSERKYYASQTAAAPPLFSSSASSFASSWPWAVVSRP